MANPHQTYGALLLLLLSSMSYATHIKGGVISVCKTDTRTFEITLTGFGANGSAVFFGGGAFDLGDGTLAEANEIQRSIITSTQEIEIVELKVVHEYNSEGVYTVSYSERDRSPVQNMDNAINTRFYVETTFESLLHNCTPTVPLQNLIPVFRTGQLEIRDLMAADNEGDKVHYLLATPMQSPEQRVVNYRYPDHRDFYGHYENGNFAGDGQPEFSINRHTGTLSWDTPGNLFSDQDNHCHQGADNCADYTIALKITEYREVNGVEVEISTTTVDFNLTVASGLDEPLVVVTDQDNFCAGEDSSIAFEVRSEMPYHLSVEPSSLVKSVNGLAFQTLQDSTFTGSSSFNVAFTGFEEGQFVTFEVRSANEETRSSFTYLLSAQCDQYVLGSRWSSTGKPVLYPNPAQDKVWVNSMEGMKYAILSVDGKQMAQGVVEENRISLNGLENGVYFIRIYSKNFQMSTFNRLIVRNNH